MHAVLPLDERNLDLVLLSQSRLQRVGSSRTAIRWSDLRQAKRQHGAIGLVSGQWNGTELLLEPPACVLSQRMALAAELVEANMFEESNGLRNREIGCGIESP